MGGTTPRYALRYPTLSDPADILQVKSLADDVETLATKLDKVVGIRTYLSGYVDNPGGTISPWAVQAAWGGVTCDGSRLVAPVAGVYLVTLRLTALRLTETPPWQYLAFGIFDNTGAQYARTEQQIPWLDWTHNNFTYQINDPIALTAGASVVAGCVFAGRLGSGTPNPLSGFSMFKIGAAT